MKAPTSTQQNPTRNWLTVARVPGITFALAALLLPTAAAGALAPGLDTTVVDLAPIDDTTDIRPATTSTSPSDEAPAAVTPQTAPVAQVDGEWPFTTGQRLTPEQIAWFQAESEELRAQGLLRGHAVWSH